MFATLSTCAVVFHTKIIHKNIIIKKIIRQIKLYFILRLYIKTFR